MGRLLRHAGRVGFDGIMTACVFAWEDRADEPAASCAPKCNATSTNSGSGRGDDREELVSSARARSGATARRIGQVLAGARITALTDVNLETARSVQADIAPDAEICLTGEDLVASELARSMRCWSPRRAPPTRRAHVLAAIAAGKPASARSRWPPPPGARSASSRPRSASVAGWCRWASCAAMMPATGC